MLSLAFSLTFSLTLSLMLSLTLSVTLSLTHSLTLSLAYRLAQGIACSIVSCSLISTTTSILRLREGGGLKHLDTANILYPVIPGLFAQACMSASVLVPC